MICPNCNEASIGKTCQVCGWEPRQVHPSQPIQTFTHGGGYPAEDWFVRVAFRRWANVGESKGRLVLVGRSQAIDVLVQEAFIQAGGTPQHEDYVRLNEFLNTVQADRLRRVERLAKEATYERAGIH